MLTLPPTPLAPPPTFLSNSPCTRPSLLNPLSVPLNLCLLKYKARMNLDLLIILYLFFLVGYAILKDFFHTCLVRNSPVEISTGDIMTIIDQ